MKKSSNYLVRRSPLLLNCSKDFSKVEISMAKSTKIYLIHNNNHHYQPPSNLNNYSYVTERLIPAKPFPVSFKENFDDAFFAKNFSVDENSRIRVPEYAKRQIERIPRGLLKKVDKNRERAIEICLFVLSLIVNKNPKYEWIKKSHPSTKNNVTTRFKRKFKDYVSIA